MTMMVFPVGLTSTFFFANLSERQVDDKRYIGIMVA